MGCRKVRKNLARYHMPKCHPAEKPYVPFGQNTLADVPHPRKRSVRVSRPRERLV